MTHERLWAPWRLAYVAGDRAVDAAPRVQHWLPGADHHCFLCRAVAERTDRENLVVHRGQYAISILNRFPYNNGHLLVAPRLHLATLAELDTATGAECLARLTDWTTRLARLMHAPGFNLGLNLGAAAGAGVPGHLHWHLVPRWDGDTNFMPVLAGAKVIPQALDALWEVLTADLATAPDLTATGGAP